MMQFLNNHGFELTMLACFVYIVVVGGTIRWGVKNMFTPRRRK
jgi:hypothetical protein